MAALFPQAPGLTKLVINYNTVGFGAADSPKPDVPLMRSLTNIEMSGIDCDSDDVLRSILSCCPNLVVSWWFTCITCWSVSHHHPPLEG